MPKVSEQHLAGRREQILNAALHCFAAEGFHATSMRDVIRASGLSAGAVYSYFPTKTALISAAVEPILATLDRTLEEVLRASEVAPGQVVGLLLERIVPIATGGDVDMTRVAISAWSEALRDPAVHAIAERTYGGIRRSLTQAAESWRAQGRLPPGVEPEALAQVLLSTLIGYVLQHALLHDVEPAGYGATVAALLPGSAPSGE